jgi:ParB-like chromosome segregation protein Spo0J
MEAHPAAELFPLMGEEELNDLVEDIRRFGLREPIVVYEGKILDGRNRWRACERLGVEPWTVEWSGVGGSPTQYVLSKNIHRRHLTPSQRAAIALEALPLLEEEAKERQRQAAFVTNLKREQETSEAVAEIVQQPGNERAAERAASIAGVNPHYVYDAKKLQKDAPDLLDEVRKGLKSIPAAKREAKDRGEWKLPDNAIRQERPAGMPMPTSVETLVAWDRVRAYIDTQWLSLTPEEVAGVLRGDRVIASRSFVARVEAWTAAFVTALEAVTLVGDQLAPAMERVTSPTDESPPSTDLA